MSRFTSFIEHGDKLTADVTRHARTIARPYYVVRIESGNDSITIHMDDPSLILDMSTQLAFAVQDIEVQEQEAIVARKAAMDAGGVK